MFRPETPYVVCTDLACLDRTCTPCSLRPPIRSSCRRTVLCLHHAPERHDCATQRGK